MRGGHLQGRKVSWRRALLQCFAICVLPILGGCLPGSLWGGDDDASRSSYAESSEDGPALNRSYKTSFLSLKLPSFGATTVEGQTTPESGPSPFTSTVETRKPPQLNAPAVLPAAQALQSFYGALALLNAGKRSQPVSVVHLGGDQIVDDRFAASLREHLIGRFGSAGRGLMQPGLYPIRGMKVDRSGQWSLMSASGEGTGPFGITGAKVTSSANDAWLRFTSVDGTFDWIDVTLMTGPQQGTAAVSVDGDVKLVPTRSQATAQTSIRVTAKAREIMIRPRGDGAITVLSVASGTNTSGLIYANVGLPGGTAGTIAKWNADFAASDFRKLNPDLIIFDYGTREGFDDALDVKQYEDRLKLAIDQIKGWAPQASILIIGPPDAARIPGFAGSAGAQACRSLNAQEIAAYGQLMDRKDERLARWHAPPRLEAVRMALKRKAAESGAFFWDWAKYMGGPCSIHAWTSVKPPLAAPDHVTLTEAGEERSARALFAELMAGFESYQRASKERIPVASAFNAEIQPAKASGKKRNH
jgi:hypothetical protein